ncbi:phosphotransferase family protein [Terrabacter sp. 2RAF25]|uniref:phosphotransferase family protein n=1 Tax=Terrabacter sp. 2RAF25 TaxID=3232998 RepID=UPI003F9ACA1F
MNHGIDPETVARLRSTVELWPETSSTVVPTHGDWQPRNWLTCRGLVSAIDFGRMELRPAMTDFARLAAQQFRMRPELECAFIDGYGTDPREPAAWQRVRIREAIGTSVWAHTAGDERFEQQGHRMIAEALADT